MGEATQTQLLSSEEGLLYSAVQQSIPAFLSAPKPEWGNLARATIDPSATPPELAALRGPARMQAERAALTCGVETAYLVAAVTDTLEAAALPVSTPGAGHQSLTTYRSNLAVLARRESEQGFRAAYYGSRAGIFDARLVCIPGATALLAPDLPSSDCVMGLVVPGFEKILRRCPLPTTAPYFAMAEFSMTNAKVLVNRLKCPVWNVLLPEQRIRFASWARVLLVGLEEYALREIRRDPFVHGVINGINRRIAQHIAVQIIVNRREFNTMLLESGEIWPITFGRSQKPPCYSVEVEKCIKAVGYELPKDIPELRNLKSREVPPHSFFLKRVPLDRKGSATTDAAREGILKVLPAVRGTNWIRRYERAFPFSRDPQNASGDYLISQPTPPYHLVEASDPLGRISLAGALAPYTPVAIPSISKLTAEMLTHHGRILESGIVRNATERLPRCFVPLSAGPRGAARQDWAARSLEVIEQAEVVHLPDQCRHPSLRFQLRREGSLVPQHVTIGSKGGGMLHDDGQSLRVPKFLRANELHSPILTNPRHEGAVHGLWGGMTYGDAEAQFCNHLGLSWLMHRVAPQLEGAVAEPIDFGHLEAVPLWNKDGSLRWVTCNELGRMVLGNAMWSDPPELAVFRSVTSSDVRLSQLVNRIFFPPDAEGLGASARKRSIDEALTYLYAVHGYQYVPPSLPLRIDGNRITSASVVGYLRESARLQGSAAVQISRKIESRSLLSMAAVHALGGHLGGIRLPGTPNMAIRGGPLSLRNVDCEGRLHDIDHFCLLPLAPGWVTVESKLHPAAQALDVITARDTMYWVELILGRRPDIPSSSLVQVHFAKRFSVQRFRSDRAAVDEQIRAIASVLTPSAESTVPSHKKAESVTHATAKTRPIDLDPLLGPWRDRYYAARARTLKVFGRSGVEATSPARPSEGKGEK